MPATPTRTSRRARRRAARREARGGRRQVPGFLRPLTDAVARIVSGDKPLIVALLGVIALSVVLLSGPTQTYLDHRARVDVLELKADVLEAENAKLAARAGALEDEETIELLAREQQGFIRPGEVPYALVPPEVERPRITGPRAEPAPEPGPWYVQGWELLQRLFGG